MYQDAAMLVLVRFFLISLTSIFMTAFKFLVVHRIRLVLFDSFKSTILFSIGLREFATLCHLKRSKHCNPISKYHIGGVYGTQHKLSRR